MVRLGRKYLHRRGVGRKPRIIVGVEFGKIGVGSGGISSYLSS